MKNHLAFLLCSATGLLAWNAAHAAPSPSNSPQSYADLLEPIPNAVEALIADDLARARQPKPALRLAQFYYPPTTIIITTITITITTTTDIMAAGLSLRPVLTMRPTAIFNGAS